MASTFLFNASRDARTFQRISRCVYLPTLVMSCGHCTMPVVWAVHRKAGRTMRTRRETRWKTRRSCQYITFPMCCKSSTDDTCHRKHNAPLSMSSGRDVFCPGSIIPRTGVVGAHATTPASFLSRFTSSHSTDHGSSQANMVGQANEGHDHLSG